MKLQSDRLWEYSLRVTQHLECGLHFFLQLVFHARHTYSGREGDLSRTNTDNYDHKLLFWSCNNMQSIQLHAIDTDFVQLTIISVYLPTSSRSSSICSMASLTASSRLWMDVFASCSLQSTPNIQWTCTSHLSLIRAFSLTFGRTVPIHVRSTVSFQTQACADLRARGFHTLPPTSR